jgi:hypothetical protein
VWTPIWRSTTSCVLELGLRSIKWIYLQTLPCGEWIDDIHSYKLILRRFVDDRSYKLLIVDSIMNLFRRFSDDFNLDTSLMSWQVKTILAEANCLNASRFVFTSLTPLCPCTSHQLMGCQRLNQFLSRLQKLAEEFNLAVVMTNSQVCSSKRQACRR